MENDQIVILINLPTNEAIIDRPVFIELIKDIQSSVKNNLNISFSALIYPVASNLDNIGMLYADALHCTNQRFFNGHGCIMIPDNDNNSESKDFTYPARKEKVLIDSLMLHKSDDVKAQFNEIIKSVEHYSYIELNLTLIRLTMAVNSAVDNIQNNSGLSIFYDFNQFIIRLNNLETINETKEHFYEMFDYIMSCLDGRKNSKHNEIVNKITDIIHHQYQDQNLYVEMLACKAGISAEYLCRLFKKITSKSIAEYITEVRLEKAKELLSQSSRPISEIVKIIGFPNNNYFYKIFKKLTGITPAEYRQTMHTFK
jgi:YesN/AraC family two-component response regulator